MYTMNVACKKLVYTNVPFIEAESENQKSGSNQQLNLKTVDYGRTCTGHNTRFGVFTIYTPRAEAKSLCKSCIHRTECITDICSHVCAKDVSSGVRLGNSARQGENQLANLYYVTA